MCMWMHEGMGIDQIVFGCKESDRLDQAAAVQRDRATSERPVLQAPRRCMQELTS